MTSARSHLSRPRLSALLGVGFLAGSAVTPAVAGDGLNRSEAAPGPITPRVVRISALQGGGVPDAALVAPAASFEPSVRRIETPTAPIGLNVTPRISRDDYRAAYHAIPFNLAEYRANPGYRHAAAMKILTGEYPPPAPIVAQPAPALLPAGGFVGPGFGPAFGQSPARGFPGLVLPGGFNGPPTFGPPPFAFDPIQGVVPTFVNRYQTPRVFLPRR
ncbi:MAG: hypothetical protein AAF907_05795 [Planctomycetota bacterium]